MKAAKHIILMVLMISASLVNGANIGDYRSATTGSWSALASWQRLNSITVTVNNNDTTKTENWATPTTVQGFPGQYTTQTYGQVTILAEHNITVDFTLATTVTVSGAGTVTARTTANSISGLTISNGTAGGRLTLPSNITSLIKTTTVLVMPAATGLLTGTIFFNGKASLALPEDGTISVSTGGLSGSVTANENIYVGSQWFAVGQSNKATFSFAELMASGGTLNSVILSPNSTQNYFCQNQPIPLQGQYTGTTGMTTSGGTIPGVNYIWYIEEPVKKALISGTLLNTTNPINTVPHTLTNYQFIPQLDPGTYTLDFYTSTWYATTLYTNNEYKTITILPAPTLTGVKQTWSACRGSGAQIQLSGLIASTTYTVSYSIAGVSQTAVTGVVSNSSGVATFTTSLLSKDDHGKTITITNITSTSTQVNCSQDYNLSTTLSVWQNEGFTWTGQVSSDWHTPANWCRGDLVAELTIPTATTDVLIPSSSLTPNSPVISVENAFVKNLTIDTGAALTLSGTSNTLEVKGSWINNGSYTDNDGTVTFNGTTVQEIKGVTNFNNLTINNTAGVLGKTDFTVNGILNLASVSTDETKGTIEMTIEYGDYSNILTTPDSATLSSTPTQTHDILNSNILYMGATATTVGTGDVTGKVKRTTLNENVEYSFGNPNTTITFNRNSTGTLPSAILFIITKGSDRGIHSNKTNTVARLHQVIRTGGTVPTSFTLKLHYKDSELNGNTEGNLVLWDHHIRYNSANTPHEHGKTSQNTTDNWVELSGHGIGYLGSQEVVGGFTKYWMFSNTLIEGVKWLGAVQNDWTNWNNPSNWTGGKIPTSADALIISKTTHAPTIPTSGAVAKTLEIEPGAVVNGGDGTLTLKGGIATNGGKSSWINNGTFNAGTSTVTFDYPRRTSNQTATISGTTTFHNVTVADSTYMVLQAGSNTIIKNAFTQSSVGGVDARLFNNTVSYTGEVAQTIIHPAISNGYHNLSLSGNGTKTLPATNLSISGNLIVDDSPVTFAAGTSTINMIGNNTQTIGGNIATLSLKNLNTTGTVNVSVNELKIEGDLTNTGTLDFQTNVLSGIPGTLANSGTVRTASTSLTPLPSGKTWSVTNAGTTTGTVEYYGSLAQTAVAGTYYNLLINTTGGANASGNMNVYGNLSLGTNASPSKGSLDMGSSHTLEMGLTGTTGGVGDVSGTVKRTGSFETNHTYTFGNTYTYIQLLGKGTKPTWMSLKLTLNDDPPMADARLTSFNPILRYYSFDQDPVGTDRTIVQLHYLDTEKSVGTDEEKLSFWDSYNNGTATVSFARGHTTLNTTENWVRLTGMATNFFAKSPNETDKEWGLANNIPEIKWIGIGSASYPGDWSLPGNWDGGVPMADDDITIPATSSGLVGFNGWPSTNGLTEIAPAIAKSITIENGASLSGNGYTLTLTGTGDTWINNGTFTAGTGKVVFTNNEATPALIKGNTNFNDIDVATNTRVKIDGAYTIGIGGALTANTGSILDFDSYATTVNYSGAAQTISNPNGGTSGYHHLILSGSEAKTLPSTGALKVKGDFSMAGSATASPTQPLMVDGDFIIGSDAVYEGESLVTPNAVFNAGSQTHFISGDFVVNSTFTAGTSTINFYGLSDNTIRTTNPSPLSPITFYNVEIPYIAAGIDVIAGTHIAIDGTLVNQAVLDMKTYNLSGNLAVVNNNGTLLTQSVSTTPLPAGKIWEGTGYIEYNGASSQKLVSGTYNNFRINNSTGALLTGNVVINTDLKLSSGQLTSSSTEKLTIACGGDINSASATSFINGPLVREYCSTGSKDFPIGKGGNYRKVTLNYTSLTGTSLVTAEQMETFLPGATNLVDDTPDLGYMIGTTDILDSRYWNITQTGGSNFLYNLTIDGTGFVAATGYTNPVIVKNSTSYRAIKTDANYAISAQQSFSDFTVGATLCAAPEITIQPVEETAIAAKETASFSVTATGVNILSFLWQVDASGSGSLFTDIVSGEGGYTVTTVEGNSILSFTPTALMHGYLYRVIVSDGTCPNKTTSNTAHLHASVMWLGKNSTDWGTDGIDGNWLGGSKPASGSDIIFATTANNGTPATNNLVLDTHYTIGSIINDSSIINDEVVVKALVIPAGKSLTVNGTLPAGDRASKIVIEAGATGANGTLKFTSPTTNTNVNATVQMYSKAEAITKTTPASQFKWQYFGIPLKYLATASPSFDGSFLRRYNEMGGASNYWVSMTNNTPLFSWNGYEVTQVYPRFFSFSGSLETGNFDRGLNYYSTARYPGQYLFSNPYTAAIDISKINFGDETEKTVYLYNTGTYDQWLAGGSGETFADAPGQYVAIPKELATTPTGLPREIPSMQGFLIQKLNNNANNLINFRIAIDYPTVVKDNETAQRAPRQEAALPYTIIDVKGSRYSDRMWLFTHPACSGGFDNGWDGEKFLGSYAAPQLYVKGRNRDLQVQTTHSIDSTELGFLTGEDTQYELRFTHSGTDHRYPNGIYLHDLLTGAVANVSADGATYRFSAAETDPEKRFRLLDEPGEFTAVDNQLSGSITAYAFRQSLIVNNFLQEVAHFSVYDLSGKVVLTATTQAGSRNRYPLLLPAGVYLVKFSNGDVFKFIH